MLKASHLRKSRFIHLGIALFLVTSALKAQCYDLRSAELHEPVGHFREHWDHPIWNAKPGERNFQVDEPDWGGALEFAIFSIGTVVKTSDGWVPFHAHRTPEIWCDPTPQRSGSLCYTLPYQQPPETAIYRTTKPLDREEWSVSRSGIAEYRRVSKGQTRVIQARSAVPLDDIGMKGSSLAVATINLETLEYSFHSQEYDEKAYLRRIPGGLKLWRNVTLDARLALKQVACPISVKKVAAMANLLLLDNEMKGSPVCAVKVDGSRSEDQQNKPATWEFLTNPRSVSAREGCIEVFEPEPPIDHTGKIEIARQRSH